MSPRAACRLATMGFEHVYDYVAGKSDWLARGLPSEGERAGAPRAVDAAHADVVTCGLHDRAREVRERVAASPYRVAFVVAAERTLLGRLPRSRLEDADPVATAESLMDPGPSTIRADVSPAELLGHLRTADLRTAVVTDPDGRLLGLVLRSELEAIAEAAAAHGHGHDHPH